jgi:signal transduction histidine kinase
MTNLVKASKPFTLTNWIVILIIFLVIISINTYLSVSTSTELQALETNITDHDRNLITIQNAHTSFLEVEAGQRAFLLTQSKPYLEQYKRALLRLKSLLLVSQKDLTQQLAQQKLMENLLHDIRLKVSELEISIIHVNENESEKAVAFVESERSSLTYLQILERFEQVKTSKNKIRAQQVLQLQKVRANSQRNNIVSLITSLLLVTGFMVLARINILNNQKRQQEIETQNQYLHAAVEDRTKELSIFSDELSRSNRELEDFAFVASHDLQEPLRKIMAFGDRLSVQSENLSDKQLDYLARMRAAASRMSTLINDLLEFSRIATQGKPFNPVDLNQVFSDCIDDLNVLIEETNAQVTIVDAPVVQADSTQMQQLFFNLIANAVKFARNTPQPKVEISIKKVKQPSHIELDELGNWYKFTIKDNGIGFKQEHAEKIFAPFQRLHSRDSYKGTGIGLAICRRIVERHNGAIEAKGNTGKGAIFEVTLPALNRLISIKQ